MASRAITVGQAAEKTGLSPKAIRLYESRGLLATTQRTEGGYRTYSQEDVGLLRFIRRAKSLGLTLEEIKQIIDLERQGTQPCSMVLGLLEAHIEQIDQRIDELSVLRETLVRMRQAAEQDALVGKRAVVCRIIEAQGERA